MAFCGSSLYVIRWEALSQHWGIWFHKNSRFVKEEEKFNLLQETKIFMFKLYASTHPPQWYDTGKKVKARLRETQELTNSLLSIVLRFLWKVKVIFS